MITLPKDIFDVLKDVKFKDIEIMVLRLRYGIGAERHLSAPLSAEAGRVGIHPGENGHTLAETADLLRGAGILNVIPERIRVIEARALGRLMHSQAVHKLFDILCAPLYHRDATMLIRTTYSNDTHLRAVLSRKGFDARQTECVLFKVSQIGNTPSPSRQSSARKAPEKLTM